MMIFTFPRKFILIVLLAGISFLAKGQAPDIKTGGSGISGVVTDSSSRQPLPYVTVSLKSGKGQIIKTSLTKADGTFAFTDLNRARYQVAFTSVGHQTKTIPVDLSGYAQGMYNLGDVIISEAGGKLKEVVITAERPLVKQEIDRLSYDLQRDPDSKGTNVLEMMRRVPMLSLDAEDNILLKGSNNYKILLNGKPSGMLERSPKEILRSMPASSIVRIEVITTPPAKYDGEGLAGIINIITNKKIDNGYNGSVNINGRVPANGPGTGGSFTMKSGRFGLAMNAGGNLSDVPAVGSDRFRETFGSAPTLLTQSVSQTSNGNSGYLNTEVSFEIDSLNLLSAQFNINGNKWDDSSVQLSRLQSSGEITQQYSLLNDYQRRGQGTDAAFNYQKGFRSNKNRLLTFSFRYFGFSNRTLNSIDVSDQLNFSDPDYRQNNKGSFSEQTFQVDYVHPVKKVNVEAGVKAIIRDNKSDFGYAAYDPNSGAFVASPDRTNAFSNNQNIYSIYNTYQYNLKKWGFKAGARLENTVIKADFTSSGTQVNREYTSVIPSLSVNWKVTGKSTLNFGYTTRIQRPGIELLNPFVDRSNPNFESTGNPGLRTATVDMFQLNYSRFAKGNLTIGLMLGFFDDLVMPMSSFNPETNITYTTYGNTGSARAMGINFDFSYPLTKRWKYNLNGNIGYGKVKGLVNGVPVSNKGLMPHAFSSTDYKLENGWRLSANIYYSGRNINLQGRSNGIISSSFSVNREVIKEKLTFSLAANNVFSRFRESESRTEGADFIQQSNNRSYFRTFSASLDYRFGKLKEGIKKNKRGIRNDDAANAGN